MKRLYILTLCSVLLAAGIHFFSHKKPTTVAAGEGLVVPKAWLIANPNPIAPVADVRPADQTFLTYPEWFLVFSPEEQANYFTDHTSTTFPFMAHTAQIWESYAIVNDQIKESFPTNHGYHFMIWVIGSSASVEYAIKAWYEKVIGRMTDTGQPITEEDRFNAEFTQDYVDFIKDRPWYEFDFKSRLSGLWNSTSLSGDHIFRKLDRRYILTSELFVKYVYGKLIGLGTKQVYEEALPTTAVILENDSLVYLPRYDRFAAKITELAVQGFAFREIAGNNSAILLTLLVPATDKSIFENAQIIFTQPISSDSTMQRIAVTVPVASLSSFLRKLENDNIKVEHVFDY